jgi:hypothetical protein
VIETASFDIQLLQNPDIEGRGYQQGPKANGWNSRQYTFHRDNYTCQCCFGASNDKVLEAHHRESRKTGGNSPENLTTLCRTCHGKVSAGKIVLDIKRGKSYRDAEFMNTMRWETYNRLKALYSDVRMTFGYITKYNRIEHGLPKSHRSDAFCITGNYDAKRADVYYFNKKVRCHNRQLHKATIIKGGIRKNNQAPRVVHGFQLFDRVLAEGREWFVFGRRLSGYFDLRTLDGTKLNKGSYPQRKIKRLNGRKNMLVERRMAR